MSIADTVAALRDPAKGTDGAWALVYRLGITVRDRHGTVVLPGSGTRTKDFFLYDFEVPALARMARGAARRPRSGSGVWPRTSDALDIADALHDGSMGRGFQMTPLEEWLHLLEFRIPAPHGGRRTARWGANPSPNEPGDSVLLAHLMLVSQSIDLAISPLHATLAEGSGNPGDRQDFVARVAVKPVGSITAGPLAVIQVKAGPVPDLLVSWNTPRPQHGGDLDPIALASTTDQLGKATLRVTAGEDPGAPSDPQQSATSTITLDVSAQQVLSAAFVLPPDLLQLAASFPRVPAFALFTVTWHEPKPKPIDRFADGTWEGTATEQGAASTGSASASTDHAPISFHFTVTGGKVTAGTITYSAPVSGTVAGHELTGSVDGDGTLSGTATRVVVAATATIEASVSGVGTTRTSTSGTGAFEPGEGTCDRVTGDLAIGARAAHAAAGIDSSIEARYIAVRTSGPAC